MSDEEFAIETLTDVFRVASFDALVSTIEAVAAELGVSQIQSMPIREFYERKKRKVAEHLVADLADMNHRFASEIKALWDKQDQASEQSEP